MIRSKEWQEQAKLFEYSKFFPELHWMFAIPNGGYRRPSEAAMFKKTGVKPGVSDIFLPVPKNGKHGMFIELKVKPNKASLYQLEFIKNMNLKNYYACVCYGAEEAISEIKKYLGGKV